METLAGQLDDFISSPIAWLWEKIEYAIVSSAAVLAMALALHYTWNPFASAFSFLHPLGGYWSCTLAALGVLVAMNVFNAARAGFITNASSDEERDAVVDYAINIAILAFLAYLVTTYLL